ncbi:hypothetical protein CLAFUW4_10350 [Fulvia fulva]|uniref:RING-type domain-containing protein n=1 Tax=Passalora fulva TaxID=5499 RepID=A0A9Q8LEA1_PASFU|nr:uncharacterized protein CLAFUR5_04965 [Fulvia fulva]KAK4616271.1 hypothetical protein CLAFUR4_10354 [Fulvia fulva]KAK4616804.1 hypothetical protein CLAFUR0_10354 [Fulvia fulva]UJO15862.1 hypothetical protein CLAFUR5_04965 [Fulvia fulva]WPV18879.1 hypothetical protein CLAFUW4_10350 [Fulvia fulva]WPV34474.1 hypothetical protein CLAFUW7_10350 [Fulvia fulva]
MTPEHKASLHDAREGDFILVEQQGGYWYLLCISAFRLDSDDVRILIKSIQNPTKQDVWRYQQYGTWRFRLESWSRDAYDVRAVLRKTDTLTIRPNVEILKQKLGCACLYEHCTQGLIRITPTTQVDIRFRASGERTRAHRARQDLRSLCPFCMGQTLFDQHEHLATHPDRYPMDVYAQHTLAINCKRQQLNYAPLLTDIDLGTMQPLDLAAPPPLNPALAWNLAASFQAKEVAKSKEPARLSTHEFEWFKTANERVNNDVCGICREAYEEGELIADLPCLHFFHEGCVKQAFASKGGAAKCPLCLCRVDRERRTGEGAETGLERGRSGGVEDLDGEGGHSDNEMPFVAVRQPMRSPDVVENATRVWLASMGH